ncbi:GNAT family N-acetyltransferase [Stackebrandtia endophytica]|uniref:GNAT family N-acetyltransferase n=1 Tax=Stackebrandtia endophytica TaxID=1496996 RepID=UPI001FE86224|nr:GNAT family N-acetyltransferase [Stackebrandtia endophytica]
MVGVELSDGVVDLVPFGLEHVEANLAGEDSDLVRWLSGAPSTREGMTDYARRCQRCWIDGTDPLAFAIMVAGVGVQAGYVDVRFRLAGLGEGRVNVSYGLYPQWRGRGLMTHAVDLVCGFARRRGAAQAVIRCAVENVASAAVAVRAGFRFEGRFPEPDGQLFEHYVRDL